MYRCAVGSVVCEQQAATESLSRKMQLSHHDGPPTFDGALEAYKEWKRRTQVWRLGTKMEESKHGARILGALYGPAWDACKHIPLESVTGESGAQTILDALEAVFGEPHDVLLIETAEAALYSTIRNPGEEVVAFMSRLDMQFRKLETSCSVVLPPEVKGFILAKQTGLAPQELRELLTLTGGVMTYSEVQKNLRRLLWDFTKSGPSKRGVIARSAFPAVVDDTGKDEHLVEEEAVPDLEDLVETDMSEGEAKAMLLADQEARARINAKKLHRGFYSPSSAAGSHGGGSGSSRVKTKSASEIQMLKAKSRCRKCGELGHWARECPRKIGSGHAGFRDGARLHGGAGSTTGVYTSEQVTLPKNEMPVDGSFFVINESMPTDELTSVEATAVYHSSHERSVSQLVPNVNPSVDQSLVPIRCLDMSEERASGKMSDAQSCAVLGHDSGLGVLADSMYVLNTEQQVSQNRPSPVHLGLCLDTGCTRSLVGAETLDHLERMLRVKQIQIVRRPKECRFRFGGDFQCVSQEVALIPCALGPYLLCLSASVVPGRTPLLLSLPVMKTLGVQLDFVQEQVHWTKLAVSTQMWFQAGHVFASVWDSLSSAQCQKAQHVLVTTSELRVYSTLCPAQVSSPQKRIAPSSRQTQLVSACERDVATSGQECATRCQNGNRYSGAGTECGVVVHSARCQASSSSHDKGRRATGTHGHGQGGEDSSGRLGSTTASQRSSTTHVGPGHVSGGGSTETREALGKGEHTSSGSPVCVKRSGVERGLGLGSCSDLGQVHRQQDADSLRGCELCQVAFEQPQEIDKSRVCRNSGSDRPDLCPSEGCTCQEGCNDQIRGSSIAGARASFEQCDSSKSREDGARESCCCLAGSRSINTILEEEEIRELPNGVRKRLKQHVECLQAEWLKETEIKKPDLGLITEASCETQFQNCSCLTVRRRKVAVSELSCEWLQRLVSSHHYDVLCIMLPSQKVTRYWSELQQVLLAVPCSVILSEKQPGQVEVVGVNHGGRELARKLSRMPVSGSAMLLHSITQTWMLPHILRERGLEDGAAECVKARPTPAVFRLVSQCPSCSVLLKVACDRQELSVEKVPMSVICHLAVGELPSTVPLNPQRTIVYRESQGQIRGLRFGLLTRRGRGVSQADGAYPRLLKLLHLLALKRPSLAPYLAIQFNALTAGNGLPAHVDSRNEGPSWVCSFGEFTGGVLQRRERGEWQDVDHLHRWACLKEGQEHRVLPVQSGIRYSVVLYVPLGWQKVIHDASIASSLQHHGFDVSGAMSHVYTVEEAETNMKGTAVDMQVGYPAQHGPSSDYHPFPAHSLTQLQTQLRQAHEKMGHPHQAQYLRILSRAGASPLVLEQAKLIRCSICDEQKNPSPPRQSALMPCAGFNQVVGVDVFHLQGCQDGENIVLNLVDWGTLYQVCVPLKQATARRIRKAYRRSWLRNFGAPQRLICDQGTEFQGQEFSTHLEGDGTLLEVTPTDSPWQNARTERHGGTVKLMFSKARLGLKLANREEREELLQACNTAKNRYSLVGGFSPYQRVFGTQLRILGGNIGEENDPADIAVRSALEAGDQNLLRSLQIRTEAREAFHYVDSSARVRRAILSGPRPMRRFHSGEIVFFWRREGDAQAFRHEHAHSHWHGPAVVVSHLKSKIWISFRGHLWLCSPEQLRPASEEEKLAASPLVQDLITSARDLQSVGASFRDITEPLLENS